jgi:predicted AAA+ superfamily ATPase
MERYAYQSLLEWRISPHRKPLLLKGARQVGKTYLLKEFAKNEFPSFMYVNFEEDSRFCGYFEKDLKPARIIQELQFHFNRQFNTKTDCLIFDEIQGCPRALTSLKYFNEEIPELALCAAGSLLGVVLNDDSFPVGKVTFHNLYPMSFREFLDAQGEIQLSEFLQSYNPALPIPDAAHLRFWDLWKQYMVVGGMPEVVKEFISSLEISLFDRMQRCRSIQSDLINAHMADIAKHSGKVNAMHLDRLWRNIPQQLGRKEDGGAPKFRFRDAVEGLRGYERLAAPLDWLEKAGLVIRVPIIDTVSTPLSSQVKENQFKLYFSDVGLLGATSGVLPSRILEYGFGTYQGYFAENFIAQELLASGNHSLYSWAGRTSEIEFLIEKEDGIIPLEIKSGWITRSKSLLAYEEKYDPPYSIILSASNTGRSKKRIYAPVYAGASVF